MQKTKIIIALIAAAALVLVVLGLASAQTITGQPYATSNPNQAVPINGFWGWLGNCFRYGTNPAYAGQYLASQAPTDGSVPTPEPYQPYQGNYGYGYGYGYGPCWAR
jgi:hypothetical protein